MAGESRFDLRPYPATILVAGTLAVNLGSEFSGVRVEFCVCGFFLGNRNSSLTYPERSVHYETVSSGFSSKRGAQRLVEFRAGFPN